MSRGVAIAIGLSAILHGIVAIVLGLIDTEPDKRPVVARVKIEVNASGWKPAPMAAVEPIEVTVFDVPREEAPPVTAATGTQEIMRRSAAGSESGTATASASGAESVSGTEPGTEPAPGTGEGKLGMRFSRKPGIDPFQVTPNVQLDMSQEPWHPPEPTGELDPTGGGASETQRPGFTGKVAPDGSVSFKDVPAFDVHVRVPNPAKVTKLAAKGLESWFHDPGHYVRRADRDPYTGNWKDEENLPEEWDRDEREFHPTVGTAENTHEAVPDEKHQDKTVTLPLIGGHADITDWAIRHAGGDPYYADKLAWMDRTRDERAEIGRVHQQRALAATNETVRRHLNALWARTDLDVAAKRELLFELWDDVAEDGEPAVVDAGARARALITGFIRAHLPAGSPAAYTPAELAELNRHKTSKAMFAPYE